MRHMHTLGIWGDIVPWNELRVDGILLQDGMSGGDVATGPFS